MPVNPIIDHELCCVYITIPKCACSTIRHLLLKARRKTNRLPYDPEMLKMMDQLCPAEFRDFSHYYVFTFIRHPISRFLSAFRDKALAQAVDDGTPYRPYYGKGLSTVMSAVLSRPDSSIDAHFRSQTYFIRRLGMAPGDLNFIGTVENFEKDIEIVKKQLRIKYDHGHLRQTAHTDCRLTEEQGTAILDHYKEDLELWERHQQRYGRIRNGTISGCRTLADGRLLSKTFAGS